MCSIQNYQSMFLHFRHLQAKQSNGFLLIHSHQDLLYIPHPLFYINYSLNKRH